jgi:hypothetical protein
MKKLSTLILLISFIHIYAQPTLNSSAMAPFGSEFHYKHIGSFTAIDTTIQGPNSTWNFTGVTTTTDPEYVTAIFNPATTTHMGTFPTANYGILEPADTNYQFFHLTSGFMERLGSWNPTDGYSTYSNTQVEYMFPFTGTSSFSDSSYISGNSWGNWLSVDNLGYGTLNVPGHSYTNVILSRWFLDFGFQLLQYNWISASNGQPVFSYVPGDGFIIPEAAVYLNSATIDVDEIPFISGLHYNNPCTKSLDVVFVAKDAAGIEYELINQIGESVRTGKLDRSSLQKFSIDLSNESAGLYLLTIKNADDHSQFKTVKVLKM